MQERGTELLPPLAGGGGPVPMQCAAMGCLPSRMWVRPLLTKSCTVTRAPPTLCCWFVPEGSDLPGRVHTAQRDRDELVGAFGDCLSAG